MFISTHAVRRRTLLLAAGTMFLSLHFVACQNSESPIAGGDKNGVVNAQSKGSHGTGEFLFEAATCKDPNPAQLGIAFRCTDESDPVCGCEGKTYINACNAWGVGQVNVEHKGACTGPTPIDPVDTTPVVPVVPEDTTKPWCGNDDPGPGVDPLHPVLDYPKCHEPVPNVAVKCTNESHPVCGCDGKTYTNACQALGIGQVNTAYEGACRPFIK